MYNVVWTEQQIMIGKSVCMLLTCIFRAHTALTSDNYIAGNCSF